MDGERKFTVVVIVLGLFCITILYGFLFVALWQYKELVGVSLVSIGIIAFSVYLRGRLNKQDLRIIRYRHHEETPLDEKGEPMYYHQGFQPNPHRR
jgi:hypothetical protein